jgi:hypothetical protein
MRRGASKLALLLGLVTPVVALSPGAADEVYAATRSGIGGLSPVDILAANASDHDDAADYEWDPATVVSISLPPSDGDSHDGFSVSDRAVTIDSAGTYQISGDVEDGQIVVDTSDDDLVRLILDNARISCGNCAPLVVARAAKAVIVLAEGSSNRLSDGAPSGDPDAPTGAIFSRENLTITGNGSLRVRGNVGDGIVSRDGLIIDSGSLAIEARDDGIRGKDYLVVNGGTTTVVAGGDGLKANNDADPAKGYVSVTGGTLAISAADDGISAATDLVVTDGTLSTTTNGGYRARAGEEQTPPNGLRAGVNVMIGGGRAALRSIGDAVRAGERIAVSGGYLTIASGADGLHADNVVDVSNGTIEMTRCYEGIEALEVNLSGGEVAIVATNDGLNADSDDAGGSGQPLISITGGKLRIRAADDGIDSNGALAISGGESVVDADMDGLDTDLGMAMSGGTVVVIGADNTGSDQNGIDVKGPMNLNGGTLLSAAASAVGDRPASDSPQGWVSFWLDSEAEPGTVIQLATADRVVVSFVTKKSVKSLFFSSSDLYAGQEYDVYLGGNGTGAEVGGMYHSGDLTGAEHVGSTIANQ